MSSDATISNCLSILGFLNVKWCLVKTCYGLTPMMNKFRNQRMMHGSNVWGRSLSAPVREDLFTTSPVIGSRVSTRPSKRETKLIDQ